MSEHTKEPWEAITDCPGKCCWHIQQAGNDSVMDRINSPEMSEADAKRIVACVNACAHIRTKSLESGLQQNLIMEARIAKDQRDVLLIALVTAHAALVLRAWDEETLALIDAVIEKARI